MSIATAKAGLPHRDHCRRCGAPIVWKINDVTKRPAPIEPEPAENGNIEILPDGRYRVLGNQRDLFQQITVEGPLHLNHFATCPRPPARKNHT